MYEILVKAENIYNVFTIYKALLKPLNCTTILQGRYCHSPFTNAETETKKLDQGLTKVKKLISSKGESSHS